MEKETQLQLVTFEQAKRLKEAGFDWICDNFFLNDGSFCSNNPNGNWGYLNHNGHCRISAPTVALAIQWFRHEKGIRTIIGYSMSSLTCGYQYGYSTYGTAKCESKYYDYDAAESAFLDELLTLIEK